MERISRWEWVGHAIKAGIRNKGRKGDERSYLVFSSLPSPGPRPELESKDSIDGEERQCFRRSIRRKGVSGARPDSSPPFLLPFEGPVAGGEEVCTKRQGAG